MCVYAQREMLLNYIQALMEQGIAESYAQNMSRIYDDEREHLLIELAVLKDAATCIVQATYILEGDDPLCFYVHEKLQELEASRDSFWQVIWLSVIL